MSWLICSCTLRHILVRFLFCYTSHSVRCVLKQNVPVYYNWARPWENVSYAICEQQRRRSACASAQSDQQLCCSLPRQDKNSSLHIRIFKILADLCSWAGQFVSCLVGLPKTHFLMAWLIYLLFPKMAASTKWYAMTRLNTKWLRHSWTSFWEIYYCILLKCVSWSTEVTHMPGNANTRKIDEVENLKCSGVSTENTVGCNLLLTLEIWSKTSSLMVFVENLSNKHSILL